MSNTIITTNLRIPKSDWKILKSLAAQNGQSINSFLIDLIHKTHTQEFFGVDPVSTVQKKKIKVSFWDLPNLANRKNKPMGANEDDKIIYGIDD